MSKKQTWFSTGVLKGGVQKVDRTAHALRGVVLCSIGEAKGHGMWLDETFINSVNDGVTSKPNGLKSRLSHPGMCDDGTGTFLGKIKASAGKAAYRGGPTSNEADSIHRYDLFLSSAASDAPGKGDIRNWVETMAEKDPDMCGFSIVFRRDWVAEEDFCVANGATFVYWKRENGDWKRYSTKTRTEIPDGEDYGVDMQEFKSPEPGNVNNFPHARLKALHAADIVDDPAATDGLFSEASTSALADRITEYLDLNPQIFEALKNPMIQEVLMNYADRLSPFLAKYEANKQEKEKTHMSTEPAKPETTKPEALQTAVPVPAPTPAAVPAPVVPDALAVANEQIKTLTAKVTDLDAALKAEQAKVASLMKGETPVSASTAAGEGKKNVPATFWG